MSTNQRKRRGEADDSDQAQKRSRLLAPSTGGASQPEPEPEPEPEPVDFKESGTLFFELAGEEFIGVTADSPDSEDINITSNVSGSVVWEQNQEYSLPSAPVDDSIVLLASDDDEELRVNDGLFDPLTSVLYNDCFLWQLDQNQQCSLVSRAADNSVLLLASDEEEGRNNNSAWSSDNLNSPNWVDEYLELIEGCEQQRSQLLLDSSVLSDDDEDEATDNDVSVTDSASEEGDSSEDETESSDAWPAGTIRCPICMDFYPQIVESGRQILSTLCGHVFCSQCLPFALQTARFCPTCRTDLTPDQYHPIYI